MLLPSGRWNNHFFTVYEDGRYYCPVADGMTTFLQYLKMADVFASILSQWQMLLPFLYVADGRPLDCMLQHLKVADVIAKWQME